jgi:hypothetical protein
MNSFRKNLLIIVDKMIENSRENINLAIYNHDMNDLDNSVEILRDKLTLRYLLSDTNMTNNNVFDDAVRYLFEEPYKDDSTT